MRSNLPRIKPVSVDDLEQASQQHRFDRGSAALIAGEREAIQSRRQHYGPPEATDYNLIGLALSGAGMRSAAFALGVLQAMAGRDLLKHVDYLSTVSGGGWIGCSLLWWLSGLSGCKFGLGPYKRYEPPEESFPYGTDNPSIWRGRAGQAVGPRLLRNLKERRGGASFLFFLAVILRAVVTNAYFWVPPITLLLGIIYWTNSYLLILWITALVAGLNAIQITFYAITTGNPKLYGRLGYSMRRFLARFARISIISMVCLLLIVWPFAFTDPGSYLRGVLHKVLDDPIAALGLVFTIIIGMMSFFSIALGFVKIKSPTVLATLNIYAVIGTICTMLLALIFCKWLAVLFVDGEIWWAGLLLAVILLLTSMWVNVNHISAHGMYRDRLMEVFMPAFDLAEKGESKAAPPAADSMGMHQVDERNGPFPIINTNLLLRGGESFILTPRYCGSNATGWILSRDLVRGPMTLPTAMAISGVLMNPTGLGPGGSRLISLVTTFIGLSVNYWIPNFNRRDLPSWFPSGVWPRLAQVRPFRHKNDLFLELGDGGHFESLGLYELVRRRARLIIVCDAAEAPFFAFEGLHCAQRRIAADFGATLDLTADALERLIPRGTNHSFPEQALPLAESGHVIGEIHYADGTKATLIYLKTTLIKDLPLALLGYRGVNSNFPDWSTADQFFDEEQFEAYRELGFIIAERMMRDSDAQERIAGMLEGDAEWHAPVAAPPARPERRQRRTS